MSYHKLATRLTMSWTGSTLVEHSQAVMLDAASYISLDVQVINRNGTPTILVEVQQSNDLENWYTLSEPKLTVSGDPGANINPTTTFHDPVVARFVRLQYTLSGSTGNAVIIAAGINVAPV